MDNLSGNANWSVINENEPTKKKKKITTIKKITDVEKIKESKKIVLKLLRDAKKETKNIYNLNACKHVGDSLIHIETSIVNLEKINLS